MEPLSSARITNQPIEPAVGLNRTALEQLREEVSRLGIGSIEALSEQLDSVVTQGRDTASLARLAAIAPDELPSTRQTQELANVNLKLNPYLVVTNALGREVDRLMNERETKGLPSVIKELGLIEQDLDRLSKEVEAHQGFSESFKLIRKDELSELKRRVQTTKTSIEFKMDVQNFERTGSGVKRVVGLVPDTVIHLKGIEARTVREFREKNNEEGIAEFIDRRTFNVDGEVYTLPDQFVADAGRQKMFIKGKVVAAGIGSENKEAHCKETISRLKAMGLSRGGIDRALYLANQTLGSNIYETVISFCGGDPNPREALKNALVIMGDKEYRLDIKKPSWFGSEPAKVSLEIRGNYKVCNPLDVDELKYTGTYRLIISDISNSKADVIDTEIKVERDKTK